MTPNQISDALATTTDKTPSVHYAVQGLYQGTWKTLFAPFLTGPDAMAMRNRLRNDNPACTYQAIRISAADNVIHSNVRVGLGESNVDSK